MDKRPWTKEDLQNLQEMYSAGVSTEEISRSLERTVPAIYTKASLLGLKSPRRQSEWTDDEEKELIRLAKNGESQSEIARCLSRSKGSISGKCRELGVRTYGSRILEENAVLRGQGKRKCPICEGVKDMANYYNPSSPCKKCYKEYMLSYRKQDTRRVLLDRLRQAKRRAKDRNLDFDLSIESLERKLSEQSQRCHFSNVEMTLDGPTTISIDRTNPDSGYTNKNTVLVCFTVNLMKGILPPAEFIGWCSLIARHNTIHKEGEQ